MIAVLAGALVSTLLWYLGAAVALLATVGIPLGSSGGPPPPSYYVVSLASSVIGAGLGGWVTASIARKRGRGGVVLLALMLVLAALLAFTRPNSNWPAWYAPVLGLLLAAGALAGGFHTAARRARRERDRAEPERYPG